MSNWNQNYGAPASQEPVFLQDHGVYVSRSRVVLNGVTFPINGITAVYSRKLAKSAAGLIIGILVALLSFSCIGSGLIGAAGSSTSDGSGVGIGCAGIGFVEFILGAGLIALYIWVQKDRYVLVIGTAGREVNAIVHNDWRYIGSVVEAINHALASRY